MNLLFRLVQIKKKIIFVESVVVPPNYMLNNDKVVPWFLAFNICIWICKNMATEIFLIYPLTESCSILGDPGADSGGEGKSKRARKYGAEKSKERRDEPLGTMSYQTSSKRSPPFYLLIGQKNTNVFWHQSEARTAATVWNWSGKTLSPRALFVVVLYFSSCHIFPPV